MWHFFLFRDNEGNRRCIKIDDPFLTDRTGLYMEELYFEKQSILCHMKNQNSLNEYLPVSEVVSVYKLCKVFVVIHENLKSFCVI